MKYKILAILLFFFFFGYFLRVYYLPNAAVNFGYDMARDAFTVRNLLSGDIKLQGPPASTAGLFHGVLYYYVIAPAYFLGEGSPIIVAYWTSLINALTIFVVFYFAYILTKEKGSALLSALLFAVSFEASQYATWLSNPTLAILTVPLTYVGLWMWLREQNKLGPLLAALGLGLSVQAELFLAYHFIPVGFWLIVERKKIGKTDLMTFVGVLFVSLFSMFLAQVRFGKDTISGVVSLLTAKDQILKSKSLGDFVLLYLNQMGNTFSNAVFPSNLGWGGAAGFTLLLVAIKDWLNKKRREMLSWQPFLATYLLAHLPVVFLGGVSTPFLTVGIGVGACMLFGIMFYKLWLKNKALGLIVVFIVVVSNVSTILSRNSNGQVALVWNQNDLILSKEMAVVDYTYREANGKPFSINTITNPLWVNTTWSYLYNWYGFDKYGYLPGWRGKDQVGRLGNNLVEAVPGTTLHFLIKEPLEGIPEYWMKREEEAENSKSIVLGEENYGKIVIQKRLIKNK